MANYKGFPCVLQKGKVIDVQEGFVDTFNWLVDLCNKLAGGKYVSFDPENGTIDVDENALSTVDVVTGISFGYNENGLVATVTKMPVTAVKTGNSYDETVQVAKAKVKDVVVESSYSPVTHVFENSVLTVRVLDANEAAQPVQVFTAVPLSGE